MKKNREERKQVIYELMNGLWDLENNPVEESQYVENEFADGKFCAIAYSKVYDANRRVCERLGISDGEDKDVESIISNLIDIKKYLCMKMYEYGWQSAKMEEKR